MSDGVELGAVQIFRGKQKKGKSFVIAIGRPTEFTLDDNIVPAGFQFIRNWAGHQVCGRTVLLSKGVEMCVS